MAKKRTKKTLFLLTTGSYDDQIFLHTDIDTIITTTYRSNTAIIINPNFYEKNKIYTHKIITESLSSDISTIVISNTEYLKHIESILSNENNRPTIHFNKSCTLSKDMLEYIDCTRYENFTFDENITQDLANELIKQNISFQTTSPYPLLDGTKFTANNNLLTQSDYYQALTLDVIGKLTSGDMVSLNTFFDMNMTLYNINLNTDLDTCLEIVRSYVSNVSKYSHSTFCIQLPNLILSKSENTSLYRINRLLQSNNCNLQLVSPAKESISYSQYTKTIAPLRKFATKLNSLRLSTIEKLILIEDYSKSRPYLDSIDKAESRKFFSSLNSDYVVCYTYASTFKALCDYTNIPCTISMSRLTTDGGKVSEHSKVICNVKDDKYGKSGLYIFEPTFDAAIIDSEFVEEETCDNYLYFANTFNQYKDVLSMSTIEYGLLGNSSTDNLESARQLKDLYGEKFVTKNGVSNAISMAKTSLGTTSEINIDEFKSALYTARSSIGQFDESDMARIIRINSYRACQSVSRCSTNRFIDENMYLPPDDTILSFDDL